MPHIRRIFAENTPTGAAPVRSLTKQTPKKWDGAARFWLAREPNIPLVYGALFCSMGWSNLNF
jgi:hypothetical protein